MIVGLLLFCDALGPLFEIKAAESNPSNSNRLAIAVEALSRLKGIELETNPALKSAVMKVLEQTRGTPQFLEIVRDFKIRGEEEGLMELATKMPNDSSGVEAVKLILANEDFQRLKSEIASSNALNVIQVLGNAQDKRTVFLLLPLVSDSGTDIALRKTALQGLVRIQDGAVALLDLAEAQKLPEDLKLTASGQLNNVHWPEIKARAARLLPLPQSKNAEALPPISELSRLKGNVKKGAEVFRREMPGCGKCHQVNGEGTDFGPNLSEIGGKLGKDALYESILEPSAGISFGYEAWQVQLKNGDESFGLIVSETPDELAIKAVGGIIYRYKKSDILSRQKQKLSVMPAGLQQAMTKEDLVDLVEYLASLKSTKP